MTSITVTFAHGTRRFYPGAVAYRCKPPPRQDRVCPGSWHEGEPDPAGHTWHPRPKGYKLAPISLSEAEPGERLLFFLPSYDICGLYAGTVAA
jgi:hypothetical protein